MAMKIKILKLEKPPEYIEREQLTKFAITYKMLKDSDWTQLADTELRVGNVIEWRAWRHKLRNMKYISAEQFDADMESLISATPKETKRTTEPYKLVLTGFNYGSLDLFNQSCIMICMELYPTQKIIQTALERKLKTSSNISESLSHLIDVINNGY